ncbi:hypothetical protein ABK040_004956 [Willaertia magna]
MLGVPLSKCVVDHYNHYYLNEFTMIDKFKTEKKFISLLLMSGCVYIVASDYKFNEMREENQLGIDCFKKVQNKQLIDLYFNF